MSNRFGRVPIAKVGNPFSSWWPPLVAALGATLIFLLVLVRTPPGLQSVGGMLNGNVARGLAGAYVLGSASALAIVTLLIVGALCLAADLAFHHFAERRQR